MSTTGKYLRAGGLILGTAFNGVMAPTIFILSHAREISNFEDSGLSTKSHADCLIDQTYWHIGFSAERSDENPVQLSLPVNQEEYDKCIDDKEASYYAWENGMKALGYGSAGVFGIGSLAGMLRIAIGPSKKKKDTEPAPDTKIPSPALTR